MDFIPSNLQIENEYPKLVRDHIPEILKAIGLNVKTKIMDDDEHFKYLLKKLVEESTEAVHSLQKNNLKEELADILELIDEIIYLKKWNLEDIRIIQSEKRQKNGGFKKKILMLEKP